jgi:hypothetical protein
LTTQGGSAERGKIIVATEGDLRGHTFRARGAAGVKPRGQQADTLDIEAENVLWQVGEPA